MRARSTVVKQTRSHSRAVETNGQVQEGAEAQETCRTYRSESPAGADKSRRSWWIDSLEDTRSSNKRLHKERLGRRCAYAWERGAGKKSREGDQVEVVVEERHGAPGVVSLSCSLSHTGESWRGRGSATTGGIARPVSRCDQLEARNQSRCRRRGKVLVSGGREGALEVPLKLEERPNHTRYFEAPGLVAHALHGWRFYFGRHRQPLTRGLPRALRLV